MTKRITWTLSLLACAPLATSAFAELSCDYGTPHPAMPEEFKQYAFMIGEYKIEVHRPDPENVDTWSDTVSGEAFWRARYILDGMGILDEWFDRNPNEFPNTQRGVNVRLWDTKDNIWKVAWQYTADPEVHIIESELRDDGRLYLWRVAGDTRNVYFEEYADGHWARIQEERNEDGEWAPRSKLEAFRLSCGQSAKN